MSELLAVKNYIVNSVLPSVAIPSQVTWIKKIQGYTEMPKEVKVGSTCAVIFEEDISDDEGRKTSPRSVGGDKELKFTVPMTISTVHWDAAKADEFEVVVGAIRQAFRDSNTGMFIADPITGEECILHTIGEIMRGTRHSPVQIASEATEASLVLFKYQLNVEVKVWIAD